MVDKLKDTKICEYEEAFNLLDKNNDNVIDSQDLVKVMREMGFNPTESEIHDMICDLDIDGNSQVDFTEFLTMMTLRENEIEEERQIMETFKLLDRDDDGFISTEDLKVVILSIEKDESDEAYRLIKEADIDGDGLINYEEFLKVMTQI